MPPSVLASCVFHKGQELLGSVLGRDARVKVSRPTPGSGALLCCLFVQAVCATSFRGVSAGR
eukprot:6180583-Alexandrium_andersonii.AAC.1